MLFWRKVQYAAGFPAASGLLPMPLLEAKTVLRLHSTQRPKKHAILLQVKFCSCYLHHEHAQQL
jgi:hypothetical protein